MSKDRYRAEDTPESAEEREAARHRRYERELERADYLLDELRDRQYEEEMRKEKP